MRVQVRTDEIKEKMQEALSSLSFPSGAGYRGNTTLPMHYLGI